MYAIRSYYEFVGAGLGEALRRLGLGEAAGRRVEAFLEFVEGQVFQFRRRGGRLPACLNRAVSIAFGCHGCLRFRATWQGAQRKSRRARRPHPSGKLFEAPGA